MSDYYTTCFEYDWSNLPVREDYDPDFEAADEDQEYEDWKESEVEVTIKE